MSKNQHEQKLKRADIMFDSITNHIIDGIECSGAGCNSWKDNI